MSIALLLRAALVVASALIVPLGNLPAAHAQKLTQTPFPDGTGSIGLAPGWHLDGAYNGAAQCIGPNGAAVILKMPWTILNPDSSVAQLPDAARQPLARIGDFKTALREVMMKKTGSVLRSVRGRRLASLDSGAPAYLLFYEYTQNGKLYTGMGYFAVLGYGQGQPSWQLYSSAVVAPKAQFARMAPQMLAMWKSWRPNGLPPREGSTSKMWDEIIQERRDSYEMIQKKFREQL